MIYAIAMSGGIDSSVAAALMKQKHDNVIGFTMLCYDDKVPFKLNATEKAINDAQNICKKINIPHYVIDLRKDFYDIVIKNFINEYKSAKTPNPCALCNQKIKFGLFYYYIIEKIKQLYNSSHDICFVSGHYAKIKCLNNDYKAIFRPTDQMKDQTYMLWALSPEQIKRIMFPLSDYRKEEIRKIGAGFGFEISDKKDSQDICFIDGKCNDFLKHYINEEPGDIIYENEKTIGKHNGLFHFTIGQRKGLVAWSKPLYVMKLDKENNSVIVTDKLEKLYKNEFIIEQPNWQQNDLPIISDDLTVKIRYNSSPKNIKNILSINNKIKVILKEPTKAITPGQSAVFYKGDQLLGGGVIS